MSIARSTVTGLVLVVASIAACRTPSSAPDTSAEPAVGANESPYVIWQRTSACMIHRALAPSIKVCLTGNGDLVRSRTLTEDALHKWLDAIRPLDSRVTSTVEFTCTLPDGHLTVDNSGEYSYAGDVHINNGSAAGTYLHEFGHAFTCLGDTYLNGTAGYCMAGQPHSVMCDGLLRNDLSSDDIDGARKQFLAMVGPGNGGGTTGGTDAGTSDGATDSGTGSTDSGTGSTDSGTTGDSDGDGVRDTEDLCAATPAGSKVWHDEYEGRWKGCAGGQMPSQTPTAGGDGDADGVTDDKDRCPSTSAGRNVWHDEYNGQWRGCASGEVPSR